MKIYAERAGHATRQVVADATMILWSLVWIRVGLFIHDLVGRLAGPGEAVERAGRGFAETLANAGAEVSDIPVVGDALRDPFAAAADAGTYLQQAGQGQQDVVHRLAFWLGVILAVVPILVALGHWLPWRLRWIREANAANRLRIDADDLHLFALRAVATRSLQELRAVSDDPAADLAAGNYRRLAALELAQLGLKAS